MALPKRTTVPQEILQRFKITNVKDNIGHDLMGMYCDIHFDKKKVGYYNDDGWGGEPDISILQEVRNKLIDLLNTHNWRHIMFHELGWNFYENESKISDDSMIENLIEHFYELKEKEKAMKKLEKFSVNEICYGKWNNYTRSGFKTKGKLTLEQLVRLHGVEKFQKYIDENIKPKLKEGDEILNPNFEALGLRK
jgi:hypothetical protein